MPSFRRARFVFAISRNSLKMKTVAKEKQQINRSVTVTKQEKIAKYAAGVVTNIVILFKKLIYCSVSLFFNMPSFRRARFVFAISRNSLKMKTVAKEKQQINRSVMLRTIKSELPRFLLARL